MNVLVTGVSGYVGRLLVPRLAALGHRVTCLVRKPERLSMELREGVKICQADLLDPDSLAPALEGIDIAYYLVHSMADGIGGYIKRDRQAAFNFGLAAQEADVKGIIYLGGLGEGEKRISPHLKARQDVGEILRMFCVPVTEFRAAIVIGSGSMSFEMIRYLTERLPILPTPRWISTLCQPIAIENVLDYLILGLEKSGTESVTYEIGGPDVLAYADIMRGYAEARRLKRKLISLPFLTTRMLAIGANVVTPLPAPYLHILIEGLRSEVVVRDTTAQETFGVKLIPYEQAVQCAIQRSISGEAEAFLMGGQADLKPGKTRRIIEGMYIEQRRLETAAEPEAVYAVIAGIGGENGWYYANWLWRLRGWVDTLLGGIGMHRGWQAGGELQPGDVVGGYTVERVESGWLIRLRNEMKAPGPAWMQFEVQGRPDGKSLLIQTAFFEPHGLAGLAYWYGLYPFHQLVFNGMARAIVRRAEGEKRTIYRSKNSRVPRQRNRRT